MKPNSVTKSQPSSSQNPWPEPIPALRPDSTALPGIHKILVALDFSPCSARAIEYATVFARAFNARLVFLHVVEPEFYPDNHSMTGCTADEANQNLIAANHERLLRMKQQGQMKGLAVELLVRVGRPYSEIPDTAKATDSDLIIMGGRGRSDTKPVMVGSTAERVVRQASCPVLMVRPQ
jgi:nucleotide-binding universal stress UspA family protein